MVRRDDMLRAKVQIFMVPLVLPIGQPRATATDRSGAQNDTVEAFHMPSNPALSASFEDEPGPRRGG